MGLPAFLSRVSLTTALTVDESGEGENTGPLNWWLWGRCALAGSESIGRGVADTSGWLGKGNGVENSREGVQGSEGVAEKVASVGTE